MNLIINEQGLLKDPNQDKFADDNIVHSFKGRTINKLLPIIVYRNLTKKGRWYSIKQKGQVVAHAQALCIRDCEFIVNEKGRLRIIKRKQKEVHAYIKGLYATSGMGSTAKKNDLPVPIFYDPYSVDSFITHNFTPTHKVKAARFCICNQDGVRAAYTERK
jgi:hypothetical protein